MPDGLPPAVSRPTNNLSAVAGDVRHARGLPNHFYTGDETHAREVDLLFRDTWAALGFAHDVAEPGMAHPVQMFGVPLLMVHGRDGTIRVFQNVCRHRGMILVDAPTRLQGVIRCPYHSWCYETDGRLRATPHVGGPGVNVDPSVDPATLGLIEVPSAQFLGVVFVNVNGNAGAFADHIAPLATAWRDFANRPLHFGGAESAFTLDVATNWKLAVENYCESYHLPWVHPGLNAYSRLEDHYNIIAPGHYSGQGTRVYAPQIPDGLEPFPDFADLDPKWDRAAEYVALYPNVLLGVHRDHTFAIILEPMGPERTREHVAITYAASEAAGSAFEALRRQNATLWKGVFEEDIFVVEGMQRGRRAPGFDGGKFSPEMDAATHAFHAWVADRFIAGGQAGDANAGH